MPRTSLMARMRVPHPNKDTYRVVVTDCDFAFHCPFIARTPGLSLAAIVTLNPERKAAVEARYPGVEVLGTAEELWQRAKEFDLVVIATFKSAALAKRAAECDLHVVLELSVNLQEAKELLPGCRCLWFTPFYRRRFDGDFRTLEKLIKDVRLGKVQRFESRLEQWSPNVVTSTSSIVHNLDLHNLIDQAVHLFGFPFSVFAESVKGREAATVDHDVFVALTHHDGTVSHLWMSAVAAHLGPRFRVLGSKASFVKFGLDVQEEALRGGADPATPDWGKEKEEAWGVVGAGSAFEKVETMPGNYGMFYEEMHKALKGGAAPSVGLAFGVMAMEVVDAILESVEKRQVVNLQEYFRPAGFSEE